jgi:lipoprotein-anchoring transpeptidase ErfK/SrfK
MVLIGIAFVAGCGGSAAHQTPASAAPASAPRCRPGVVQRMGDGRIAYSALVPDHAVVFRSPGRHAFASFGPRNVNGHATVFRVLARRLDATCEADWYRVELPIRPNGATGWVPARRLRVGAVHTRIVVDLSQRRLTLYRDGRPVLRAPAAIGSPATPTPTGRFYVDQRLIPADPRGPWGPGAIGVSAHSEVLRHWVQGGPIAIHGTNEPFSIGQAASHGCIRLDNRVLQRLFSQTPAGTPVVIRV